MDLERSENLDFAQREFVERALKHLFVESQLDGIKFGFGPGATFIRFVHYTSKKEPSELWINIESKWTVFPSEMNDDFPNTEYEKGDLTEEEEFMLVFQLRRDKVVDIKLGDTVPNIFIVFQSGLTMFVNGRHDMYECWQAGDGAGYSGEEWLIVAAPEDDIAIWAPDDFQ
ncbi:hypothetical protein [Bacillus sp. SM2101]|uniref:hypothetical protein n=1 Tax=Bacillus sp. SM2101 TaxID=2805366 RepID=UPI001BDF1A4D|nr:hypothetical protein [Bacillus sp. SM2101]